MLYLKWVSPKSLLIIECEYGSEYYIYFPSNWGIEIGYSSLLEVRFLGSVWGAAINIIRVN